MSDAEAKLAKIRILLKTLEAEVKQIRRVLQGSQLQTEHECYECGHWQSQRCWKGYVTQQDGKTPSCREFIPRSDLNEPRRPTVDA